MTIDRLASGSRYVEWVRQNYGEALAFATLWALIGLLAARRVT